MIEEVETQRLIGRRINLSHLEFLITMQSDPVVMETLGGVRDESTTIQNLQWNIEQWGSYGHGLWVFYHKDSGQVVGRGGLRKVQVEGTEEVEVGYALLEPFWGMGLATEIARISVQVAFIHFDYGDLVSFTLPTNSASQNVMKKVGFKYEKNFLHADLPHVLFRLKKGN